MPAIIRPDDWNFPLFLHVLGAMTLVGALALAATAMIGAWRGGSTAMVRLGFRALLLAALPGWIAMRFAGEWLASKEDLTNLDPTPSWLDIGFTTSDAGLVVLIVATVVAGLVARRASRGEGARSSRVATVLVSVLLVAYLVTVWAMTTKPT